MILEEIHYSIIQVISDYDEHITAPSTQTLSISFIQIFKALHAIFGGAAVFFLFYLCFCRNQMTRILYKKMAKFSFNIFR